MDIPPMALSPSLIQYSPLHALRAHRLFSVPSIYTPKIVLKNSRHCLVSTISCSAGRPIPTTEEEVIQAVLDSDQKILPSVRTYENDLSRLTLVGGVDFRQSITAAAADGGETASEHLDSGMSAMVVETLFPGTSDEHSTVSTRLFLPAREVQEKARKLKKSFAQDIHLGTSSKNILAMTFRQVVLQQLWNFELVIFIPGSERNMKDLENPREVPISFTLNSSDERAISALAEAVCMCALQNTERKFVNGKSGGTSTSLFDLFRKYTIVSSKDSSIIIYKLFDNEVADAKTLLQKFNSNKQSWKHRESKSMNYWWPAELTELEKIGGAEFSAWASEYVPSYRLQVDARHFTGLKFEGWRKSVENRWEVLLTHSQMVGLANILDSFYEDVYSLPDKQLQCGAIVHSANLFSKKRNYSSWGLLSKILAGGIFLVAISAVGQHFFSRFHMSGRYNVEQPVTSLHGDNSVKDETVEATKLEEYCISVVKVIKDAFGWLGDIHTEKGVGAWIGEAPDYLRVVESDSGREDDPSGATQQDKIDEGVKASAQDIASYQVVLSTEGKVVGFQPTSRVAVNYWAANPLAKQLYGGRNLSPGLIESGLRIKRPEEVIVIELLMSVKTDAYFALARPAC